MSAKPLDSDEMAESSDEFETIYEANAPLIYRFMFFRTKDKMLAEDLTSHVFEKAWRSRASFKGGSAISWLYTIARNTLIDHWRKRHEILVEDPATLEVASDQVEPAEAFDQARLIECLEKSVAELPEDMRNVIELRFIKGYSARLTGQQLGLSESNVRVIQYRALRQLKEEMQ